MTVVFVAAAWLVAAAAVALIVGGVIELRDRRG